ncbi:Kef-type K+ transport system, predicted NAD-binding component [Candidatus Methanoperedens nitroreducens]|uniref:Kef-type K+ transport system, predicted NAD-binding component n=1 Tax=Candidatus Methanoperedens nitratireducens TaxID=1392998 RepID=A0A062UZB2_9EURY|nr:cation:proton antiporter [Candidatus Methanoperedens nitroreducens]KCZ70467.1 Kef-type K+ transport system, predicted NAD-binding component [Candidatus Methanoperedens nitroreducens]MDJ1420904.1 cation:proton antiporter [Candidatus Methanoperedens sp.]
MAEPIFLRDFAIIFGAAIGITLLFHHLRIAPIVGYLIAGVLLGPSMLGIVGDIELIEMMAEVGVILLLFLIGVEFSLAEIIRINRAVFVGGFLQVFLTTALVLLVALSFGASFEQGIFIGFLVALSSTAIVLKVLSDRGEIDSPQGRLSAAILIFQDLSVMVMVLLVPILGGGSDLSIAGVALNVFWALAIVVLMIAVSRFVVPFILYRVVQTHNRELFLISIVLICFGTAWLTSLIGLSLALGAFLAGLIISESEYGQHAFSEILPLKDIFSILFFVSIGMLLDIDSVLRNPLVILLAVLAIFVIKFAAGILIPVILGYPLRVGVLVGASLYQIGEFSFVLSKEGINLGLFSGDEYQVFLASAIITMVFTPFMIQGSRSFSEYVERLPIPHMIKFGYLHEDLFDRAKLKDHVVVVGFGLNGRNVSRVLSSFDIPFVVLEINPETVQTEKKRGVPILYGDASKEAVLEHIDIMMARSVVIAISDASATRGIVELARRLNPSIYIIARTRYMNEVNPLYSLGANDVIPEEFETSIGIISRLLHRYFIPVDEVEKHIIEIRKDGYEMFRNIHQKDAVLPQLEQHLPDIEIETIRIGVASPLDGKTLAEVGLRKKYGVTVLAVQRGRQTISNPSGDTQLLAQDIIILIGTRDNINRINSLIRSYN